MSVDARNIRVQYDIGQSSGLMSLSSSSALTRVHASTSVLSCQEDRELRSGEVLADGPATANGEVALGKNALIGFMTWEGYNYEDAVLINEKLVRDDVYTSIHIEEYEHRSKRYKARTRRDYKRYPERR